LCLNEKSFVASEEALPFIIYPVLCYEFNFPEAVQKAKLNVRFDIKNSKRVKMFF
jgi:hypothetical protein